MFSLEEEAEPGSSARPRTPSLALVFPPGLRLFPPFRRGESKGSPEILFTEEEEAVAFLVSALVGRLPLPPFFLLRARCNFLRAKRRFSRSSLAVASPGITASVKAIARSAQMRLQLHRPARTRTRCTFLPPEARSISVNR